MPDRHSRPEACEYRSIWWAKRFWCDQVDASPNTRMQHDRFAREIGAILA